MKTNAIGFVKIFGLILLWLPFGCGPTSQVFTDYDRTANLEEYKTFGWVEPVAIEARNNPIYYNELNDKRIKLAVAAQMESRNYTYSENPELLIHYHIIIEDKTVMRTDPYGYYGPYWMRTDVTVYEYREGTLIIDLMDAETNSLVWRGWITSFLKNSGPDKMEESIDRAVRMIFSEFPYHASKSGEKIGFQD
jgi:Domain of unknown function (DUF4136)